MAKKLLWFFLLLLSISLCACSTLPTPKPAADFSSSQCLPSFPDKDGWYGGDGAYSIKLDKERTLWLFGDTFAANDVSRKDRVGMDVVLGTTLAISTCSDNDEFRIKYYLKKKNSEFISSFGENEWLWPQDPFMVNGILYVPLLAVAAAPEEKPPFNFKIAGHKIAQIKYDPSADPHEWSIKYIDLTPAVPASITALATTSVVLQDYVYFYPLYQYEKGKIKTTGNILARIRVDKLNNPAGAIEYLNKDGSWDKELKPRLVKIVLDAGVSELSVRYHADDKKWLAIYSSAGNKGQELLYQWADALEGPWSAPSPLIAGIPEVDQQSPLYDKNTFCYAGKEHIEFAGRRNLIVTYVCNSAEDLQNKTSFIRKNLFLYRPVVRKVSY
jgi:nuclear transport factor 2 (NTF2) superfamily protein